MKDALDIDLPFAREILAREIGVEAGRKSSGRASDRVAAAERALTRLNEQLVRWFGPDGVDALLLRALDNARKEHPVLSSVQRHEKGKLWLAGIASQSHNSIDGASRAGSVDVETGAAVTALLATLVALIGRLVGNDMTRHLITQIWPDLNTGTAPSSDGSDNEGLDT